MANALFTKYKEKIMDPGTLGTTSGTAVDLIDDNIKVCLVDHALDTPVPATDEYLDDISAGIVATTANLSSKAITGGVFDAADTVFSAVASGDPCESLVIYKDTGTASTSPLIAFIDTATGLPVTPNDGDINVTWDSGANKIFAL